MKTLFKIFLVLLLPLSFSSCDSNFNIIDGLEVSVEPNIETAKIQLNFSNTIQSDLGGSYAIKDYGSVEVNPWTPDSPFSIGFRLNTDIFNDQDFASVDPVTTLPSGQPIPIPNLNRAFARLKMKEQPNPNFDVWVYVDVVGMEWIGVAVTLNFLDQKTFPAGISISQNFLKKNGIARGVGAFFGPGVDNSGHMTTPGGLVVFANIKSLIEDGVIARQKADGKYVYGGKLGSYYQSHPKQAYQLGLALKQALNLNKKQK